MSIGRKSKYRPIFDALLDGKIRLLISNDIVGECIEKLEEGLQEQARLEVSGILKGSKGIVNKRMIEKIRQTQKSDDTDIPAYIVVVEFSEPMIKIRKR